MTFYSAFLKLDLKDPPKPILGIPFDDAVEMHVPLNNNAGIGTMTLVTSSSPIVDVSLILALSAPQFLVVRCQLFHLI